MNNILCPVSALRVNQNTVRLTAFLTAILVGLYIITGNQFLIYFIGIDFFIRAFTPMQYSPMSWLADKAVTGFKLAVKPIDKAPKIFAARIGFLFSFAAVLLFFVNVKIALIVLTVLLAFALLEAVFNFCAGCVVYTYVVLPLFGKRRDE
ncbi:MAG: DUF4395 domain-containing protein [FCB group bacterium]|nr:DUF4395 domain-containing protein [FCB group bacterium]